MPHKKKDGRRISYFLDSLLYNRLSAYAEENEQTMTAALEHILRAFLDAKDKKEWAEISAYQREQDGKDAKQDGPSK